LAFRKHISASFADFNLLLKISCILIDITTVLLNLKCSDPCSDCFDWDSSRPRGIWVFDLCEIGLGLFRGTSPNSSPLVWPRCSRPPHHQRLLGSISGRPGTGPTLALPRVYSRVYRTFKFRLFMQVTQLPFIYCFI